VGDQEPALTEPEIPLGRWQSRWRSGPVVEARYVGGDLVTVWWNPAPIMRAVKRYRKAIAPQIGARLSEALEDRGRAAWVEVS
jgi:hypothetical protein